MGKVPLVCRRCWWQEGGACFNEDLGPISKDPETGLRVGHDLSEEHLAKCGKATRTMPYLKGKAKKDKKKGPVNRFVLLMNNSRREEKESTMEKQATGISLLKTTIKDGATRAKRLRAELLEDPTSTAAGTIQWRQFSTRQSVRHLNLAYGFLRGTSYAEMERTSREEPNWKVVKKLVEEYGVRVNHLLPRYDARKTLAKGQEEQESRWESWLEEAKVHFEDNRIK